MSERMTPRERVLTALAHRQPDRVPFGWGFGPTPEMGKIFAAWLAERGLDYRTLRQVTSDIAGTGPRYIGPETPPNTDMWGIVRKPVSYGGGTYDEFEHYPLAGVEDAAVLADYPWPSADDYDYSGVLPGALENRGDPPRAMRLGGHNPFEIYSWMTGLTETLMNVVAEPDLVRTALTHITDFMDERLRRCLALAGPEIDLVFLADDLGSQHGLLISREAYRDVIQPFHRQLCDSIHELAPRAKVMFHSDGDCFDVLPDLLDAGIDMLEAVQVDCPGMDPQRLKDTYGDRLCFHGAISVQALLPHCSADEVKDRCRELVAILGKGGGYVAAPSHAIQVGTPPENILAMLEAVLGDEDYHACLEAARI